MPWLRVQLEYNQRKKEEGKKTRLEKEQVQDLLFAAFEKHQYYNVKDLVRITNQPIVSTSDLCVIMTIVMVIIVMITVITIMIVLTVCILLRNTYKLISAIAPISCKH